MSAGRRVVATPALPGVRTVSVVALATASMSLYAGISYCRRPNVQARPQARGRRRVWAEQQKARFAGFLRSPLTDSNRRPPPYHSGSGEGSAGTGGSPGHESRANQKDPTTRLDPRGDARGPADVRTTFARSRTHSTISGHRSSPRFLPSFHSNGTREVAGSSPLVDSASGTAAEGRTFRPALRDRVCYRRAYIASWA